MREWLRLSSLLFRRRLPVLNCAKLQYGQLIVDPAMACFALMSPSIVKIRQVTVGS
jgi:hypothetical protein